MAETATQDRLAGSWNFAAVHSSAHFSVRYLVASFRTEFTDVSAELTGGQLSGAVKVASAQTKSDTLTQHLMGADFFDAERFPEITFRSSRLTITGDDVVLEGELTMKGETRPLKATGAIAGPSEDFMGNTRLGFTLTATIDRTDFGVSWNADLPNGGKALADDVELTVELEFTKAA
jgi:polyisoprenoid-binding protein YceI